MGWAPALTNIRHPSTLPECAVIHNDGLAYSPSIAGQVCGLSQSACIPCSRKYFSAILPLRRYQYKQNAQLLLHYCANLIVQHNEEVHNDLESLLD